MPRTLSDLVPDPRNPRRHDARNVGVVRDSIAADGFGRSLLLASDDTIIAGNATAIAAAEAGLSTVRVIETDGTEVIAVKRTDVASGTPAFARLSVSDNRGAELATWDPPDLAAYAEAGFIDRSLLWSENEWFQLLGDPAGVDVFDASPQLGALEYRLVIECDSESHQAALLAKFEAEGLRCRALIS